jgi:hypothetical protein
MALGMSLSIGAWRRTYVRAVFSLLHQEGRSAIFSLPHQEGRRGKNLLGD